MPPARYQKTPPLTDEEIIELFASGRYRADLNTGEIFRKSIGVEKPIYLTPSGRTRRYRYVRLYAGNRSRVIGVHVLIWIVGHGRSLPDGCEVHHIDEMPEHNGFDNLAAVYAGDHGKLHGRSVTAEVPF